MKPTMVKASIPVIYMKEGAAFLCYAPAFDLVAHGDSFEDAQRSFAETLRLFVEEVTKKGTWKEVLREYGWEKIKRAWSPPRIIGQENRMVELPASA
ncbi:MAG: hypothetical protein HY600_02595 [Candidatus Omnitrophica bacterium]|nr:hypothetical protein [Candidatus Omnitrophota bacterium]